MVDNEILAEIRRVREEMARECGYDLREMFRRLRKSQAEAIAAGWKAVDFPPEVPSKVPSGAP